jgi:integrase
MTAYVFRPKRRKNGKMVQWRTYSGRYRLPGQTKITTVALHVSDKAVAEAKLRQLIRDIEQEEIGIVAPKRVRLAAEVSLLQHINAYCDDLAGRQRAPEHIATIKARLTKLAGECDWKRLIDVTPESFQAWRATQNWAPKTLNDYLAAGSALFSWLQKAGLVERNPLSSVGKSETRGKERRKRRAFTPDELGSVVAVAGEYRTAILTAYYTGLRRNELEQLEWGDLHTSTDGTFIIPRTSTTKNHETKRCYLPWWFARELVGVKPRKASTGDRIFPTGRIPSIWAFRTLLKRAGISYRDDQGRQADFHALRRSLNTHLAQREVDPHTRKEIMRHSDIALTLDVYTDKSMLPVAAAVEKLPIFARQLKDAHLDSHNPDFSSHSASSPGTARSEVDASQQVEREDSRHVLALTDTTEQNCEKHCLARTRT